MEVGCNLKSLWSVANITSDRIGRRDFLERWQAGDEKDDYRSRHLHPEERPAGPPAFTIPWERACPSLIPSEPMATDRSGRKGVLRGWNVVVGVDVDPLRQIRHVMPEGTPTASPTGRFAPVSTRDETPAQPTTPAEANRTSASPSIGSWNRGGRPSRWSPRRRLARVTRTATTATTPSTTAPRATRSEKTVGIPHDPPQPTHVHVVVVSCKGLRGADFTGYSDPFVEVGAIRRDQESADSGPAAPTGAEPVVEHERVQVSGGVRRFIFRRRRRRRRRCAVPGPGVLRLRQGPGVLVAVPGRRAIVTRDARPAGDGWRRN